MGPTGGGKTTIGRLMVKQWGWPFIDADDLPPRQHGEDEEGDCPER